MLPTLLRVHIYYYGEFTVIRFTNTVLLYLIKYSPSRHSFQINIVVTNVIYIYKRKVYPRTGREGPKGK